MKKSTKYRQKKQAPTMQELNMILSGQQLCKLAQQYGVEDVRDKPLPLTAFVFLMLLGCSLGKQLSFPELAKHAAQWHLLNNAHKITGNRINQQLGERGEVFSKALFQFLLGQVLAFPRWDRRKITRYFTKILSQDGSVIRLSEKLVELYTGTHGEAALKIQVRYEVLSGGAELVGISDGKRSDQSYKTPQKYGKDVLWLLDLGYYDFDRFKEMDECGQYFVSRIKSNGQPLLIANCPDDWIGRELQEIEAVSGIDYDMEGILSNDLFVRVLGLYNAEEDTHWWYITNIPGHEFSADEIQSLYRLRWEVELFFRSIKHILNVQRILNQKDTGKIRSQIHYVFSYYLLIHLVRLKSAYTHRVKWQHYSFACCERLIRTWLIEMFLESRSEIEMSQQLKWLLADLRKEAYVC